MRGNVQNSGLERGNEHTCMILSSCAKRLLWQSPKSRPQILIFLSADAVTTNAESSEISKDKTGNYRVSTSTTVKNNLSK